ncbi:MAG: hypothetical protein QM760_17015 [Nibricoccus sp.]
MKGLRHLLLFLFLAAFSRGEEMRPDMALFFRTPENLEIVTSPEWVEACILYPKKPWFSRKHPTKYREGKYQKLSAEEAALLSSKLSDEKTYKWNSAKACMPTYNARVRFHHGSHVINADFCFGCDIVIFRKDGEPLNGEDFDNASSEIFEVIRTHFPKDSVVSSILAMQEERRKSRLQIEEAIRREKEKKAGRQPAASDLPATP